MAVDILYSVEIGLLAEPTARQILHLIASVGFELWSDFLDQSENGRPVVLTGLEEFREHLGGKLTITLVPEIGRKVEVNEMDEAAIIRAMDQLRSLPSSRNQSLKSV